MVSLLNVVMLDPHDVVITGDLKFHLDFVSDPDARHFSEKLADHGMAQLVTDATHSKGYLLDVVIVRNHSVIVNIRPSVYDPRLCDTHCNPSGDHMAIKFCVNARNLARVRKEIIFRRLRHIRLPYFKRDITSLLEDSDIVAINNTGLRRIADNEAPLRKTTITLRPDCPWYTDELRDENQRRRRAERTWLLTHLEVHRQAYRTQRVAFNSMLVNAKKNYYTAKIANRKNDQKQLFNITRSLIGNDNAIVCVSGGHGATLL